tara:strand:+ start:105 stop:872 length:768 start_codon:yes stop_codon:yes gene_type:complete
MLNINSKDNSFYKTLKKISANKKFRLRLGQTLLDGAHLIKAFQKYSQPLALIKDESMNSPEVINLIQNNEKIKCLSLSHDLFLKLSELKTSSGILGLVEIPKNILVASPLTLLLYRIQDPGNLGTILRTASASGIKSVVLSPGCADIWAPKTLRASQGFQFGLSYLTEQDLSVWIDDFDGEVFAFTMGGQSIYNTSLNKNIAILIGSEGSGIDAPLLEKTDGILSLPMQSDVESVNAAVAASVFMYEFYRQNEGK